MKPQSPSPSRRSSFRGRGLSLSKNFFARPKSEEIEHNNRNPRPGDFLRLEGFGGEVALNDGAVVDLQTLVNISVSGVVVFTQPQTRSLPPSKQVALFKDAYQELTKTGFGLYGLSRGPATSNDRANERTPLPVKWIYDEQGLLITALGLEKCPGGDLHKGVVVIAKDGRVIASTAGGSNATVEAVAPLVQTLDILERTPAQEWNGEEYFTRSPTSPCGNENSKDDLVGYFAAAPPVSPSIASLHSYLQAMDSTIPGRRRSSISVGPATATGSTTSRRPVMKSRMHTWHAHDQTLDSHAETCPVCEEEVSDSGECGCDAGMEAHQHDQKARPH